MTEIDKKQWPATALDWRQVRVGDPVWAISAEDSPTGEPAYAFRAQDGRTHRASVDAKSSRMGLRHLLYWSRAGTCTATLAEARRVVASRGR